MTRVAKTHSVRSASIHDVAKRAKVAAVTVSRVFSNTTLVAEGTRRRVLKAARELGYRRNPLAAALRGASSRSIGILWSSGRSNQPGDLSRQLLRRFEQHQYVALALDHFNEWSRTITLLEELRDRAVDAIVIQASETLLENPKLQALLSERPCLIVGVNELSTEHDLIVHDRLNGYAAVTDHLLTKGRQRLGFLGSALSNVSKIDLIRSKVEGANGSLTLLDTSESDQEFSADRAWERLSKVDSKSFDLDAVICTSDAAAVAAHRWLIDQGLSVPGDVALVGCNNFEFSVYHQPPLATLEYHYSQLGEAIERLIFTRLGNLEAPPLRERVEARFLPRESAG